MSLDFCCVITQSIPFSLKRKKHTQIKKATEQKEPKANSSSQ